MQRRPWVLALGLLGATGAGAGTWFGDDIAQALRADDRPEFGEVGGVAAIGTLDARPAVVGALSGASATAPAPTTTAPATTTTVAPTTTAPTEPPTTAAPTTDPPTTAPPTTAPPPTAAPTTAPPTTAAPTTTPPPTDPPPPPTTMPPIAFTAYQWSGECSADPPWDKFWGTASPGSTITVSSAHGRGTVVADDLGHWFVKVYFPTAPLGEYVEITVSDGTATQSFPFLRTEP
jgi:hypothetical protein